MLCKDVVQELITLSITALQAGLLHLDISKNSGFSRSLGFSKDVDFSNNLDFHKNLEFSKMLVQEVVFQQECLKPDVLL